MGRSKFSIVVYLIIGLAVIGLISQLFGNTINFLTNILIMIGIGVAVFALLYYFVLNKRNPSNSDDMKKYKKAVKQSKSKYKQPSSPTVAKQTKPVVTQKKKRSKRATHLKVIEGNKAKRKDRASL
ncbi:SA1362 family protein [Oceanobacillus polygoni]|uniref:Lipid-binding transport protein (Tim44 family) n=1 Tax=Oceanobacillus polygoni TaxID=1235259 RepID=A0A9X0YTW7_9BACI|nr:SA1362 family protein [Oceanobacillus polygoni]MBP2078217.1 putative lipid-binding transport protein (Tim44 family) [Oceanobacillus polygoni]